MPVPFALIDKRTDLLSIQKGKKKGRLFYLFCFSFYLNKICVYLASQEQLHESEQTINELERRMEDKDRELHEIKLDNEAVC